MDKSKTEERLSELEADYQYKAKVYAVSTNGKRSPDSVTVKHKIIKPGTCSVSQCGEWLNQVLLLFSL